MESVQPLHSYATRVVDEVEYFVAMPPLTDAELAQYSRRTTKRPLLCFAMLAALPFVVEGVCRLLKVW
ncbi:MULTISPECIES: hypothetical protein [Paraburkholderia]|jgi:hypothetical protein|uniref:Uncharacterized protein n=1 Tax=Paraburkholderia hospita TaxID=169430 RepID=A0AAN1J818_9BURK|nr:hypothetical protein [Paraburkholderia hospita]AUT68554.1 hypothetical protein C2L64_09615 [Paraburkholderia hospita]SEI28010.1 hypothetical protein SAMN05192544_110419 [Paraburkholderia hospita]